MTSSDFEVTHRKATRVAHSIAAAIAAYTLLAYWFAQSGKDPMLQGSEVLGLRVGFLCLSVAGLAASGALRRRWLTRQAPPSWESEASRGEDMLGKLLAAGMLTLGLCELPAFLGMLLAYSTRSWQDYPFFLALSLLGLYQHYPRRREWKTWISAS